MLDLRLNGIPIKTPNRPSGQGFRTERFELVKAGRLAGGLMTKDIVAVKRKFFFDYAQIHDSDYRTILDILENGDAFFELQYAVNGRNKLATVYVGPISRSFFRYNDLHGWYYRDFKFNLIER